MAIAVLFGLMGLAAVVGKIGGRRLPLVAADLLKYRLGARLYVGPPSQLLRSGPPAPAQPVKSGPVPPSLTARRIGKTLRRIRPRRKSREKTSGRMPFRPHRWFGRPRRTEADKDRINGKDKPKRRKKLRGFLGVVAAVALAAAMATVPQTVLADGHEPWRDEIGFEVAEPVEGRRIFVEVLTVSGDRAAVTSGPPPPWDIRVRAFGGPEGNWLRFWVSASLDEGEAIDYSLPLYGPVPSFTVSWEDTLGQAGALTVEHDRIPYPLPEAEGELCDLRMTSLGWTPGAVKGVIESQCVPAIEEPVQPPDGERARERDRDGAVGRPGDGHHRDALGGDRRVAGQRPFVADGGSRFTLPVGGGEAVHAVSVGVSIEASLSIPMPPLTVLTHHPERTERRTETVSLYRPGASDTDSDSQTITVTHDDGATTDHTVSASAYAYVPARTIQKDVTIEIVHPEHVKAEVVQRQPIGGTRVEALAFGSGVGSDDPFAVLALPEPEPEDPPAEQTPEGGLRWWFDLLGWEWPW